MINLPSPPPIVGKAIFDWQCWLHALPRYGPVAQQTCGSEEKAYAHITRKLQCQYHNPELRPVYDRANGENFNEIYKALKPFQREVIKCTHLRMLNVRKFCRDWKTTPERYESELRKTYLALAAKLET